ncbi:uncharacterized protein LOC117314889 [Pecten maximus]|uniref:uncharacterized protein LOC117314889 n=1 Tax=Pecten maximus TaxID=6579 RepID=UPI001458F778|nr:uncharacterized protein LOC117314889 [Pecten maximus]
MSSQTTALAALVNTTYLSPRALRSKIRRITSPDKSTCSPCIPKQQVPNQAMPSASVHHVEPTHSDKSNDSIDAGSLLSAIEQLETDQTNVEPLHWEKTVHSKSTHIPSEGKSKLSSCMIPNIL